MKTFLRILSYLKPYRRNVIFFYLVLITAVAFQVAIPDYVGRAIDSGVQRHDHTYLWHSSAILLGLALVQACFLYVRSFGTSVLAERVGCDIREELYAKLQTLPFQFYDHSQTGQLMSRATEDVNNIRSMMARAIRAIVHTLAMIIIVTVVLVQKDWRLALIALSTTPILFLWSVRYCISIRPIFLRIQQQFGVMTSVLHESVAGGRVVRAFAQEQAESERFEQVLRVLLRHNLGASSRSAFNYPLTLALNGLSTAGVIWYGGYLVLNDKMSIGTLVAFQIYTMMLQEPIRSMGIMAIRIAQGNASGKRIFEILDTPPAIRDLPSALPIGAMKGVVQFENVDFCYVDSALDALSGVTFRAEPGQIIALVGPTGSGKSSIVNLIPRFYDVTNGAVTIDGVNVRDITIQSLRQAIGLVMQETFLSRATVRDNIAFGDPDASLERVVAAAKAAQAHNFIMQLQDGYATAVGERGVTLSGGQKQRLAIARALLIDPRILILDDATASVDSQTEHEIHKALRVLMTGRTCFVIAQRLSTIQDADQILVLEHGTISQRGNHAQLLQERGFYRELYELQLRDQERASARQSEVSDGLCHIQDQKISQRGRCGTGIIIKDDIENEKRWSRSGSR